MEKCNYAGDYLSGKMTNVINIMVTGAFSQGKIPDCDPTSANIGYIGGKADGALGPDQMSMYNLGLGLLLTVVVLIPVYLCLVPCVPGFRNADAPYSLD
jgi:hypothetical protein